VKYLNKVVSLILVFAIFNMTISCEKSDDPVQDIENIEDYISFTGDQVAILSTSDGKVLIKSSDIVDDKEVFFEIQLNTPEGNPIGDAEVRYQQIDDKVLIYVSKGGYNSALLFSTPENLQNLSKSTGNTVQHLTKPSVVLLFISLVIVLTALTVSSLKIIDGMYKINTFILTDIVGSTEEYTLHCKTFEELAALLFQLYGLSMNISGIIVSFASSIGIGTSAVEVGGALLQHGTEAKINSVRDNLVQQAMLEWGLSNDQIVGKKVTVKVYRFNEQGDQKLLPVFLIEHDNPACDNEEATTGSWTFGGPEDDWGGAFVESLDGNLLVTGSTHSYGEGWEDMWTLLLDGNGSIIWDKTFGQEQNEQGRSAHLSPNETFTLFGSSEGPTFWLLNINSDGDVIWSRSEYGGYNPRYSISTRDGGFLLVGDEYPNSGNSDIKIVRVNGSGDQLWSDTFVDFHMDFPGYNGIETSSGDFLIPGYQMITYGNNTYTSIPFMICLDENGNEKWFRFYSAESGKNNAYAVVESLGGGFYVLGITESSGEGGKDISLIKTDDQGVQQWQKTYGGPTDDVGTNCLLSIDGNLYLAGTTTSFGNGDSDIWIIKTDGYGNEVWNKTYGGSAGDYLSEIKFNSEGGLTVIGTTSSFGAGGRDIYLLKLDIDGNYEQ
jgi:hypothetical protein